MTDKVTVRKFLARKSFKRKRSKSPSGQQQRREAARMPCADDDPPIESYLEEGGDETMLHNNNDDVSLSMKKEGAMVHDAAPDAVVSAAMDEAKEVLEDDDGCEESSLDMQAGSETQFTPSERDINPFRLKLSPLDRSPQSSNSNSPDFFGGKIEQASRIERLDQLLMQKDVTIQQQSDELQSTRIELQASRKQCQKHKQRAFEVQQKFLRWDRMLQEWMARNRSKPMEEWDARPEAGFEGGTPATTKTTQPAVDPSTKTRKQPVASATTTTVTPATTTATKRSAHSQFRQSPSSTPAIGATPIQQRITQINKLNKTSSSGATPAQPLAPTRLERTIMVPPTAEASRSIQKSVPRAGAAVLRSDDERTRKGSLPSPKGHPASNENIATSSHKSNGDTRRMDKSFANGKKSQLAPSRDDKRLQLRGEPVRHVSRKLYVVDDKLSKIKPVPRKEDSFSSNPKRKGETEKISMAKDKPTLEKLAVSNMNTSTKKIEKAAKKRDGNKQQAPEHKSDVKELSSTIGSESELSEKNRVSRAPLNSDDNLRMTRNKENRNPNEQQRQDPRRVTVTPKQQRTLTVATPLSQYDESQTQLDPRASTWKVIETPEMTNSRTVLARTAETNISNRMMTTPASKKSRLAQDVTNGGQVSFTTPLANDSMLQRIQSQAWLASGAKETEKLSATSATKERVIQPEASRGSFIDSRDQQPPNTMAETAAKSKATSKSSASDFKAYSAVRAMNGWISNVSARTFVDEAFTANKLAIKNAKSDSNGSISKRSKRTLQENPYKKPSANRKTSTLNELASNAAKSITVAPSKSIAAKEASDTTWFQKKPKPSSRYRAGDDGDESQVEYKHIEVVRGKKKRSCLPGHACAECDPFWNAVCDGNSVFQRKQFEDYSRHRATFSPENTPPDFWELSFVDERREREKKERQEKEM